MKRHVVSIRLITATDFLIALFSLFVALVGTINNSPGAIVLLLPIALFAIASGICLLIDKPSGRWLSFLLGLMLLCLGLFLLFMNSEVFFNSYLSVLDKLDIYFDASFGYIDLICIGYGIFSVIYFTRKNVKAYLNGKQSVIKVNISNQT